MSRSTRKRDNPIGTMAALAVEIEKLYGQARLLRARDPAAAAELGRGIVSRAEMIASPLGVARGMEVLAWSALMERRYDDARADAERALEIFRQYDDPVGCAGALNALAVICRRRGELPQAWERNIEALELSRRGGDRREEAEALVGLGTNLVLRGEYQAALEQFQEALRIAREEGRQDLCADILNSIGIAYMELARHDDALATFQRALDLARETGYHRLEAHVTGNIAVIHDRRGDMVVGLGYYLRSLRHQEEVDDRRNIALVLINIGRCYHGLGDYSRAFTALARSNEISRQIGDVQAETVALNALGSLYSALGEPLRAFACYQRGLEQAQRSGSPENLAWALSDIGSFHLQSGDTPKALLYFLRALRIHQRNGSLFGEQSTLRGIGAIYHAAGEHAEAESFLSRSVELARSIGVFRDEIDGLIALGRLEWARGGRQAALEHVRGALDRATEIADEASRVRALKILSASYRELGDEELGRFYGRQLEQSTHQAFKADGAWRIREQIARFEGGNISREGRELGLDEEDLARVASIARAGGRTTGLTDAARKEEAPKPAPRGGIRVQTLGAFRVVINGRELERSDWARKRPRDLFKLLLLNHRGWLTVDDIYDRLWSGEGKGNPGLLVRNAIAHIRKAIEPERSREQAPVMLRSRDGAYSLDLGDDARIDFLRFKELVVAARRAASAGERTELYTEAVALYEGDFLPEDTFQQWSEFERRVLKDAFLEALEFLAREHLRTGRLDEAIESARTILRHDETGEGGYEVLLRALKERRRAGEALRAFEECTEVFRRELGEEPPEHLRRIVEGLAGDTPHR